jgi:hypothetical protein
MEVENYRIHKAKAAEQWLAAYSRFTLLLLPIDDLRANPIERAFGDVHDTCTHHHQWQRLPDLLSDLGQPLRVNGLGSTSCLSSVMSPRSLLPLSEWRQKKVQWLPRECTNLVWSDLTERRMRIEHLASLETPRDCLAKMGVAREAKKSLKEIVLTRWDA